MKLKITGDAYALTSEIKVSDIALLKKYDPASLTIVDEEKQKPLFGVDYIEGKPSVAPFGVTFGGKTRDENEYATITGTIPTGFDSAKAAKEFVAEKFGGVVAYLEQLEKSIPEVAKAVKEKREKFLGSISLA